MSGKAKKNSSGPESDHEIDARLGAKIRETYAEVLDAPLPTRFLDLLDQLERADEDKKTKAD